MGKLRTLSGQSVCKILQSQGFVKIRQRGSHIIMQRQLEDTTITVPVPDHKTLKTGTLKSIIRQSQLPSHLFETQ
ncbi:type II toxin-antitoxin system HicA family toxin [Spirulina subsalsa]|uniref:type II toxin-antitoxin system HicA family toxin n=1 Tax=Spirulina TaxID=1154 RepID=UPI003A8CFF73